MKDNRLISLNAAIDAVNNMIRRKFGISADLGTDALLQLPSAQTEIIRCKDCKYNPNPPELGNAACVLFYGMTDQMGFCHHGERREQE